MLTQSTHISLLARLGETEDGDAWVEFQARYGELIRRVAMRRGLQAADCDDVLQETMVALGKAMPGFEYDPSRGKFRAYLKTVVSHVIFSRLRQIRKNQALHAGDERAASLPNIDHAPTSDQTLELLWESEWRRYHLQRAMRTIEAEFSEADRAAFTQYALEGHDAKETSQLLGVSIDQVYQAKSRIVKRLSTIIGQQVAEEG